MENKLNAQEALYALKQLDIIVTLETPYTFCVLKNHKIRCTNEQVQFTLTIEAFVDVYQYMKFTVYNPKVEEIIDPLKDFEYYQFKHK